MYTTYMIIAFSSTHQAIHFERLLLQNYAIELIPTPRELTASCGLSLKFEADDLSAILKELEDEDKTGIKLLEFVINEGGQKIVDLNWGS